MKVFISWSGNLSNKLAEVFSKWLPSAIQAVQPYFTPDDIEKGARWSTEIARELETTDIGILFVTRDNIGSKWILYEAGALSKQLDKSRVCPIIFGITHNDLPSPLRQYQATEFKEADFKRLLKTINNAAGEKRLSDIVLERVFEMWWSDLARQFDAILKNEHIVEITPLRPDRELLEEILDLCRFNTRVRSGDTISYRSDGNFVFPYRDDEEVFVLKCPNCGFEYMHQERVEIFDRGEDSDMVRKTVVDESGVTSSDVPNDGSGNPSYRRQGLRVFLACEQCSGGGAGRWVGPRKILNIVQHKGETLISWERR
jgi:TIR domain